MTLNAVDVANYTGPLSASALAQWKSIGVELVIVQAIAPPPGYPPEVDRQQAQAVLDADLKLGAYAFHWTGTVIARNNAQRFASYGFPVERWWADFEDTTASSRVQRESEASALLGYLDTLGGKRPAGVYSGKWWTDDYLPSGSQVFAGRAIWVAQYDNVDTLNAAALCGGTVTVHQYIGTSTLKGVPNVDLDVADPAEFTDATPDVSPAPAEDTVPARYTANGWNRWEDVGINLQGIADSLGAQVDSLKAQLASQATQGQIATLQAQLAQTAKDRDAATQARNALAAKIAKAQADLAA